MDDSSQPACPWAFLPTDLLLEVSGRLHNHGDFVRFHAVCRPWRDAAPGPARRTFPPWLISECPGRGILMHSPVIYPGSEATSTHRRSYDSKVLVKQSFFSTSLVVGVDGEAIWRLAWRPEPAFHDLVTGAATSLPPFPENYGMEERMRKPRGVVSGDGTVFLYSFVSDGALVKPIFTAAILRPRDMAWTVMEKRLDGPVATACAAYHDGKVLVWVGWYFWCIMSVTHHFGATGTGGDIDGVRLERTDDRLEVGDKGYIHVNNYVLESDGEMLRASVLLKQGWFDKYRHSSMHTRNSFVSMIPPLKVILYALEKEPDGKMRWVERDGRSLAGRVLFLGFPASFTESAAQLGLDGGCVYFVHDHRVFKYNLVNGETELMESPSLGRIIFDAHVWLRPKPVVAPIQELIHERLRLDRNKKNSMQLIGCISGLLKLGSNWLKFLRKTTLKSSA